MTSCKEINIVGEKRTKFQVEFNFNNFSDEDRGKIVEYLKEYIHQGSTALEELADIIEKG